MSSHHDEPMIVSPTYEPDPVIEYYMRFVDRTTVRENLKRTVTERLTNLMALQRLAEEVRRAGRAAKKTP